MHFAVTSSDHTTIETMRRLFLSENRFQFVYDKCYRFGWADIFVFTHEDQPIGYGSLWGKQNREERDTIFEFFLVNTSRKYASQVFLQFAEVSKAGFVQCQTNDLFLTQMLFLHTGNIEADAILFEDSFATDIRMPGTRLTRYEQPGETTEYRLEQDGKVVASGGFVWNYNFPYIDLYYDVEEDCRRKGYGALMVQELKKEAYALNRVPSARCNIRNTASRATLQKAGMSICGHMLTGKISSENTAL